MKPESEDSGQTHSFRSYDPRLEPIAARVMAGERLDFNDGLALYGSPDVLAVGWLANHVRERMHGDVTYFHVNRHINPTNVCGGLQAVCIRTQEGRSGRLHDGAGRSMGDGGVRVLRGGYGVSHRRWAAPGFAV